MPMSFTPYRWEPVMQDGHQFRLTFTFRGSLAGLAAEFLTDAGTIRVPFTIGEGSAELILDPDIVGAIRDRGEATIIVDTGRGWEILAHGHVTKRGRRIHGGDR